MCGGGEGGGSLLGDGEALVNLRIMSGVRAESCLREGIFKVRRLCSLAAHLYFMLPLRQMKPEPPGTRGDPLTLQREVLWVAFFIFFGAGLIPTPTHIHNTRPPTHAETLLRPH